MPRARLREKLVCHYCGVRPGITTDHIVPRAFGGPDAVWNYVSACAICNSEKASSWPTCDCEKCTTAVERFLTDPAKREKAMSILMARADDLTNGIEAKVRELQKLKKQRTSINLLYANIATYDRVPGSEGLVL